MTDTPTPALTPLPHYTRGMNTIPVLTHDMVTRRMGELARMELVRLGMSDMVTVHMRHYDVSTRFNPVTMELCAPDDPFATTTIQLSSVFNGGFGHVVVPDTRFKNVDVVRHNNVADGTKPVTRRQTQIERMLAAYVEVSMLPTIVTAAIQIHMQTRMIAQLHAPLPLLLEGMTHAPADLTLCIVVRPPHSIVVHVASTKSAEPSLVEAAYAVDRRLREIADGCHAVLNTAHNAATQSVVKFIQRFAKPTKVGTLTHPNPTYRDFAEAHPQFAPFIASL